MLRSKKILPLFLTVLMFILVVPFSKSEIKPYYTGDAIVSNGVTYIASTNSGYIELFTLRGSKIVRQKTIESLDPRYTEFYDLALTEESGTPYLYAVNGRYLSKYDISDPANPELKNRVNDNSFDWFNGVGKFNERIYTQGTKEVKVWNYDLQVVSSYEIVNEFRDNVSFSNSGSHLFNIDNDMIEVVDSFRRNVIAEIPIRTEEGHNRGLYADESRNRIYVVDDREVYEYNFEGRELSNFKHISHLGYDTQGQDSKNHFYFTDGKGVVKLDKNNLQPLKWIFTTNLGDNIGWAMGLSVVDTSNGEVVVVFNNDGILALDGSLQVIDYYDAREVYGKPVEELYLNLSRGRAHPGSPVLLTGGGFGAEEELEIKFLKDKFHLNADSDGRFSMTIDIPEVENQRSDIKVTGLVSGLTYSIALLVE